MARPVDLAEVAAPIRRSLLAWPELLLGTALMPILGLLFRQQDPFFLQTEFPWLLLAPVLLGLRYGFSFGLGSAAGLTLGLYVCFRAQLCGVRVFPASLSLGMVLCGMVAGEFCDMWTLRLREMAAYNQAVSRRMEEFTRAYHLISISHEQLERRLLGNTTSLRESLQHLRKRVHLPGTAPEGPLCGQAEAIVGLLGDFGWLHLAAVHEMDERGQPRPEPAASLGTPGPLSPDDPVLRMALAEGQLASIRAGMDPPGRQEGPEKDAKRGVLLAAPFCDLEGRAHGVLVVYDMPFVAFRKEQLQLLAILCGHIGDVLAAGRRKKAGGMDGFPGEVARAIEDFRQFRIPAVLLGLTTAGRDEGDPLLDAFLAERRGLDREHVEVDGTGHRVLLLLMPLTDEEGCAGYLLRMARRLGGERVAPVAAAEARSALRTLGVRAESLVLSANRNAEATLADLRQRLRSEGGA